jgi:TPR repeat protein
MKKIVAIIFYMHTSVIAQQSIECQLMQQRVSGKSSDPKLCLAIYQQCSANAKQAPNIQAAQNQCSVGLGACQMGGELSGESLQQAIEHYKKQCEKGN